MLHNHACRETAETACMLAPRTSHLTLPHLPETLALPPQRFQHALGMTLVAKSDLSTSNTQFASYVLQSNDVVFAFTAPYSRTAWKTSGTPSSAHHPSAAAAAAAAAAEPAANGSASKAPSSPLPHYDQVAAHEFIASHGLAVKAVGE